MRAPKGSAFYNGFIWTLGSLDGSTALEDAAPDLFVHYMTDSNAAPALKALKAVHRSRRFFLPAYSFSRKSVISELLVFAITKKWGSFGLIWLSRMASSSKECRCRLKMQLKWNLRSGKAIEERLVPPVRPVPPVWTEGASFAATMSAPFYPSGVSKANTE